MVAVGVRGFRGFLEGRVLGSCWVFGMSAAMCCPCI